MNLPQPLRKKENMESREDKLKRIVKSLYAGKKQGKNAQRALKHNASDTLVQKYLLSRSAIDTLGIYAKLDSENMRKIHDKKYEKDIRTDYALIHRIVLLITKNMYDNDVYVATTKDGDRVLEALSACQPEFWGEYERGLIRKFFNLRSIFSTQERNILLGT